MKSYNLGIRLVRNAGPAAGGIVEAAGADASSLQKGKSGKVLIAYFSWSGNTRGIAQEIQRQTGEDWRRVIGGIG